MRSPCRAAAWLVLVGGLAACSGRSHRQLDAAADAMDGAGDTAADARATPDAAVDASPESTPVDVADGGPESPPWDVSPDAADVGPFTMRATLIGMTDHAGTDVEFPALGLAAKTEADGRFTVPGLPDGTHLVRFRNGAFEEEIPELVVRAGASFVRYRNGTERAFPVVELPRAHRLHAALAPPYAVFSPANNHLLIRGGASSAALTVFDGQGRGPRVLASDVGGAHGFIDEDRVFFGLKGTGINDGSRLMSVPVGGGPAATWLSPALSNSDPTFVLGRTKVVYGHAGPLGSGLAGYSLVGLDGMNPTEIGVGIGLPAVSPDGFWFAASSSTPGAADELRLTDLRSAQTRSIDKAPAAQTDRIDELSFSPDSRWLIYANGRRIMSAPVAGGAPIALGLADSVVSSPDGRFVLVRDRYDSPMQIVAVDSGVARTVPGVEMSAASHSLHGFSRDSRYIFPAAYPTSAVPVDTLVPRPLSTNARDVRLQGYVTATRTVFFTSVPWDTTATVVSSLALEAPDPAKLVTDRPVDIGRSKGGRFLYYVERALPGAAVGAATLVDLDSGRSVVFRPAVMPLHFAPDESRILYFDGGDKVQVGDLSDGRVITVGTSMRNPDLRGFSPDGSRVVFGSGGLYMLATSDGSTTRAFARQIATALQWKGNQLLYPIHDSGDRPAFIYGLYLAHAL